MPIFTHKIPDFAHTVEMTFNLNIIELNGEGIGPLFKISVKRGPNNEKGLDCPKTVNWIQSTEKEARHSRYNYFEVLVASANIGLG